MHRPQGGTEDGEVGERRRPHHMGVGFADNGGVKERGKLKKPLKGEAPPLIVISVAQNLRVTCPT